MKVQLAELKNKPVKEAIQTLVEMNPEEFNDVLEELADKILTTKTRVPLQGVVATFLKSELKNPESLFVKACAAVKLPPTKRQASKWCNKRGLAYTHGRFGGVNGTVNVQ